VGQQWDCGRDRFESTAVRINEPDGRGAVLVKVSRVLLVAAGDEVPRDRGSPIVGPSPSRAAREGHDYLRR
jgi:hypothetical protein